MINYTLSTRIKSFAVALSLMLSALFILKFARMDVPSKMKVKDGDSVVALRNMYSTFIKVNLGEIRNFKWSAEVQKISANSEGAFKNMNKQKKN
ncbi:MAG: hypothetical protein ABI855_04475 [Bacteroidota bacterium]